MEKINILNPNMLANDLEPVYAIHPGETIKDEIEARGITQRNLAKDMGIGYSVLNEILNCRRSITEKTAIMFEAALGISATSLLTMQSRYNMMTIRNDKSFMERIANIRRIAAVL